MRVSLPLRLFLVHLIFTVGAGTVAVLMVRRSFERYSESWQHEVAATFAAELYGPMAAEVARSLLLGQESEFPEVREERQSRITKGLHAVLKGLPSIRSVLIVDREMRIQYASDSSVQDLTYTRPAERAFLASNTMRSRTRTAESGDSVREVVIPVFEERKGPGPDPPRRLGSVLVRFVPDASLAARTTERSLPDIPSQEYALPVVLFLAAAAAGAIAVAALTGLPVQRLDRAVADLRARDFRGRLDPAQLGVEGRLLSAVQAINELGGRLEALDARGREREALLEKLAQSLEEGMLAVTPGGVPVAWNPAVLRILSSAIAGEATGAVAHSTAGEEAAVREALGRNPALLKGAEDGGAAGARDMDLVRADGTRVTARITEVPFETRPGEMGTLLLIRDLATLRTIETHLMEAGRFAVLAHLAAGLAHEIRNPLHSIGLNATVVEEYLSARNTPERRTAMGESIDTIKEETQRLAELLNSYLGLVRPEAAACEVDLREISRRVIRLLGFTARKSQVEIRLEGQENLPAVHGVADRLQQAVLNLVLNAIQAMPGGGVVSVRTSVAEQFVHLTVSDTGPGLPESLADHLFDTRVTTKPGGTGLGLPLVRMIAEAHGGSVRHRSRSGEGAAFTLVLPASGA